ncbi:MAG: T9SS type A sorting domain-containing protein [Ignavibacteriaceae bacterium]
MKLKLLMVFLVLGLGAVMAQSNYPVVSIHDIQYVDSVGAKGWQKSAYTNDTVRIVGVVMIRPVIDPDTNRTPVMYYGTRWGTYLRDTSSAVDEWAGLNVLQNDTSGDNQNTFFDLVDSADVVEMTGVVTTYNQTNELMLLLKPVTPVNIISHLNKRPDPVELSLTDLVDNGVTNKANYKYCGMYVELHNVISSDRSASTGQFRINDKDGNYIIAYPQSRYFRTDANKVPGSTYEPPQDGTPINSIKGILTIFNDTYEILPIYPNDLYITLTPPTISNITRDPVQVKANDQVTISAQVTGGSGYVKKVDLHYRIGDQDRVTVQMTKSATDTTIFTSTINGISSDSTIVDYFITANDNLGLVNLNPSDTVKGNYFYQVLNDPLTIRDIQYSPLGSGYSSFNGYYVTLTGVVTADTSDIPGFGTSTPMRIYMQEGNGPWSGIMIGTHGNMGADVLKFKRGDNVTLNGRIMENYNVTSIDSLKSITINSNDNNLPDPVDLKTGDIADSTGAKIPVEQWESVLVDYKNVTVTNENADGDPGPNSYNFGESLINDGSGDARIEFQDGNHNYNNAWDSTLADNPENIYVKLGSTFSEIKGILFYSHSYYKIVPRKNDDFIGYMGPTAVNDGISKLPTSFKLDQNYPNPFNPSTTINFSIPRESMVSLKIFNILGQEVKTLVNENKAPGNYSIRFNANNLSSGIYFYSLKAGSYNQVKKMMLLK